MGVGVPRLSPDGTQIAYVRRTYAGGETSTDCPCGSRLYVVGADGTDKRLLREATDNSDEIGQPSWSPDGATIVFSASAFNGYGRIHAIASSGGTPRLVRGTTGGGGREPRYSSDGRSIIYFRERDPASSSSTPAIAIMNSDGGNDRVVVGPSGNPPAIGTSPVTSGKGGGGPVFSPDGSRFAYGARTAEGYNGVFIANVDGTGRRQLTAGTQYGYQGDFVTDWSPDGTELAVNVRYDSSPERVALIKPDGGSSRFIDAGERGQPTAQLSFLQPDGPPPGPPPPPPELDYSALLRQHVPVLRYDKVEGYRADSASTITNNYLPGGKYGNYLKSGTKILAAADPSLKSADLNLGYLGSYSASSTHYIDEANNYSSDAQRLHGNSAMANQVYGRVVRSTGGAAVLQYWLFYYYNPKTYLGALAHEGDWEMMQVELDDLGHPTAATYAQHNSAECRDWPSVERTPTNRPIVYVGEGSHASFFAAGYYLSSDDTANGDGEEVNASTLVDITTPPGWLLWPGKWGASSRSPSGPPHQGAKWDDPLGWKAEQCGQSQTRAAGKGSHGSPVRKGVKTPPSPPPTPRVSARRRGGHVVVNYRFARMPEDEERRPEHMLIAVDGANPKYPPLAARSALQGRRGTIRRPVGLDVGPYKVNVSVVARNGQRGVTISVPVE